MRDLIKKIILENYEPNIKKPMYGYHITNIDNLDGINKNGLQVGTRQMQGKGFYAFENYKNAFSYGIKDSRNFAIVQFSIKNPKEILIFDKELREEYLGNVSFSDQVDYVYSHKGGKQFIYDNTQKFGMTKERVDKTFNTLDNGGSKDDYLWAYRDFMFEYIPANDYGYGALGHAEYGVQFLIKNTNILKNEGYYIIKYNDKSYKFEQSDFMNFDSKYEIPEVLQGIIYGDETKSDINSLIYKYEDIILKTRNNKEYNILSKIIEELKKLV